MNGTGREWDADGSREALYESAKPAEFAEFNQTGGGGDRKKQAIRIGMTLTTVGIDDAFHFRVCPENPDVNFEVHDGITYTYIIILRMDRGCGGGAHAVMTGWSGDTELHQEPMIAVIPTEMRLNEGLIYDLWTVR